MPVAVGAAGHLVLELAGDGEEAVDAVLEGVVVVDDFPALGQGVAGIERARVPA